MNFNLYLDDQTAKELDRTAKKLGETRSGLIRKALREWLDKKTLGSPGWPSLIPERQGAEVEYGLARNPDLAPRVRAAMRMLLSTISVPSFEREDARVAAQLRANLNSRGTPVGAYDLLLAARALRRGLKIVTHNAREFVRVGGLGLEDWHGP